MFLADPSLVEYGAQRHVAAEAANVGLRDRRRALAEPVGAIGRQRGPGHSGSE